MDSVPFKIFATDISETAIEKARAGVYTDTSLAQVTPRRLARFFNRTEGGYEIARSIRDLCVFARHDLAQDPPFSKLDLISCCNVLIYLGPALQHKVLSILHYALKPGCFLLLGPSEGVGTALRVVSTIGEDPEDFYVRPAASALPPHPGRWPPSEIPRESPRGNRREPGRDGCAERGRPVSAGGACPCRRNHRPRYEYRSGPGPHRSLPGAFAWRADPQYAETGARRHDSGIG